MIDRSNRIARRYAGMLSDGVAEGSIRPVDPLIASQSLMALQNAAFDMRKWASAMPRERAVAAVRLDLCFGLFDDSVVVRRQAATAFAASCSALQEAPRRASNGRSPTA